MIARVDPTVAVPDMAEVRFLTSSNVMVAENVAVPEITAARLRVRCSTDPTVAVPDSGAVRDATVSSAVVTVAVPKMSAVTAW